MSHDHEDEDEEQEERLVIIFEATNDTCCDLCNTVHLADYEDRCAVVWSGRAHENGTVQPIKRLQAFCGGCISNLARSLLHHDGMIAETLEPEIEAFIRSGIADFNEADRVTSEAFERARKT
jgi:hypothetical protein